MANPDPISGLELTTTQLDELFRIADAPSAESSLVSSLKQKMMDKAALMGVFVPSDLTEMIEPSEDRRAALEAVLRESVVVPHESDRRWLLEPRARVQALSRLGDDAVRLIEKEIPARAGVRADPFGDALHLLIRGDVPESSTLPDETIRSLAAMGGWVKDWSPLAADKLPEWNAELKRRQLLQPLKDAIGGTFVGRDKQVKMLREYVDVLPPESTFEGWSRWLSANITKRNRKAPAIVHGIGGIGKSALMAHFILTHAAIAGERGFPFVYLDFDRPRIDPHNPATLLLEVLDQIGSQFVDIADRCARLAAEIRDDTSRSRVEQQARSGSGNGAVADFGVVERATATFIDFLIRAGLADRPFLLVLDTFEEVQVRGETAVESVFSWLDAMYSLGSLRTVISGRAPIADRKIAKEIRLTDFDRASALSFLETRELGRGEKIAPGVAREIHDKVGGNPLSLKLCILIAKQEKLDTINKDDLQGFLGRKDSAYIQGYLYTRLLRHIGDKSVEALAHPGLVLRRITPEIILEVLAPAVGLAISSLAEAQNLYKALRNEISLVTEIDGALIHRKDVRSVMLGMQRDADPEKFIDLNRRAIAYYLEHEDLPASSLERTYHRLMLEEEDAFQVVGRIPRETLSALGTSIDDLPEHARVAVRAGLGQGLARSEVSELPDDAWAAYAYRRAMALVVAGSPDDALKVVDQRKWEFPDSVLNYPRSLALFNLLDWDGAEQGLAGWDPQRDLDETTHFNFSTVEEAELLVRPLTERGYLLWFLGRERDALISLGEALRRADVLEVPMLRIEATLGSLAARGPDAALSPGFGEDLELVPDEAWRSNLVTLRRLVFLGFATPAIARIAVSLLSLRLRTGNAVRDFAETFARNLSPELQARLEKAAGNEVILSTDAEMAKLERAAVAELLKVPGDLEPRVVAPFIRGRFAAWKIPVRSALLRLYPERENLESLIEAIGAWRWVRSGSGDSVRSIADRLINAADERDEFVPTVEKCLSQAGLRDKDVFRVPAALKKYARQLSRYHGYAAAEPRG